MYRLKFTRGASVIFCALSIIIASTVSAADAGRAVYDPYLDVEGFLQRYDAERESLMVSVNIWGQVVAPGKYKVPDGTDVVSLISYAGGPTEYAALSEVRLSRPSADGGECTTVAVDRYMEEPVAGSVPILKPGDVVYVPKNNRYAWKAVVEIVAQVAVMTSTALLIYEVVRER